MDDLKPYLKNSNPSGHWMANCPLTTLHQASQSEKYRQFHQESECLWQILIISYIYICLHLNKLFIQIKNINSKSRLHGFFADWTPCT